MITYEQALEIARDRKDEIDNCIEYENTYVFGFSGDDNYIGGYGHTPVVIMKVDGRIALMPELDVSGTGEEIRSFNVSLCWQLDCSR